MEDQITTKAIVLLTGVNSRERYKAAISVAGDLRFRGITPIIALPKNSLYERFFTERGYEVVPTPVFPESKGLLLKIAKALKMGQSIQDFFKLFEIKSISGVLSFGGNISLPALEAAVRLPKKVKVFLVEQNADIAKVHEEFVSKATRIYLPFQEMEAKLNLPNSFVAGIPVEREVLRSEPMEFTTTKKKLLVLGCRKDTKEFNDMVFYLLDNYSEIKRDFYIIQETGERDVASISRYYEKQKIDATCEMFYDNRGPCLKAADIVISRPNSDVIAEITALKKQAIYIPLPQSKDYFQKLNALQLAKSGAAYLIEDRTTGTPAKRYKKLMQILSSYTRQEDVMKDKLAEMDFENSSKRIAGDIEFLLQGKH